MRMSSPPSSRTASRTAALILFSSVTSQGIAKARTPRELRSITADRASLAECLKVIATSASASANAIALCHPSRFAPPVIKAVLPDKGLFAAHSDFFMVGILQFPAPRRSPSPVRHSCDVQSHGSLPEKIAKLATNARVSPCSALHSQGVSPVRAREGEPGQAASPRRVQLERD